MKKILYFILPIFALMLNGCDPLDDTYNDLGVKPYTKDMSITLSVDQYKSIKGSPNVSAYIYNSYYFKSEEEAGKYIPYALDKSYPQLDDKSSAIVKYNYLEFDFANQNRVSAQDRYTVSSSDYSTLGFRFGNFSSMADIVTFLDYKYPNASNYYLAVLNYKYYNSSVSSSSFTTDGAFYKVNGTWMSTYLVTIDNYTSTGNGRFKNYTAADEAQLPSYFDQFLKSDITFFPTKGSIRYVAYYYYPGSGSSVFKIMTMAYDGINWYQVKEPIIVTKQLTFSKKEGKWVPDLTIRYTLVDSDYAYIANNSTAGSADSRSNLGRFGNFYQASTSSPNYWSDDDLAAAFSDLLKNKYPNSTVGQKYEITYLAYKGSNATYKMTVELQANGIYKRI